MSVATELTRIQNAKSALKTSIENKGVTVSDNTLLSGYSALVDQIQTGGGGGQAEEDLKNLIERDFTSITIPDSVTSIGYYAFYNCTSLTSIAIPDSVTSIGYYAFYHCTGLTSVTIPDSVTSIDDNAFQSCTSLTSITFGNGVTSIGNATFNNCSSLTSVNIPSGVTSIGNSAFYGCRSLTSVTIEAETPPTLVNANAFGNTNDCPIYVPAASLEAYKTTSGWSEYVDRLQTIS